MNTFVVKYGGSSVATIEKIQAISERIAERYRKGERLVVVLSAMGKSTNQLIEMAHQVTAHPDPSAMDMLMATGEQVSIALMSMALNALGCPAVAMTGMQAGIRTNDVHTKARIEMIEEKVIRKHLDEGSIVVIAGFQGHTEDGRITTLGRGGSDTTAVSIAAVLGCPCEIYTDVDGVYTVDPRIFPTAKKLSAISYEEMLEMASTGSKILETRSVEMASKYKVPLLVALSSETIEGTWIKECVDPMEKNAVTGLSIDENCLMVTVNAVPYQIKNIALLFTAMASAHVNIDMISQTAPYHGLVNVSFTAKKEDRKHVIDVLAALSEQLPSMDFSIVDTVVKLSVVGIGMVSQTGVAAKLFELFSENEVDFFQVTTSEISISYTLAASDRDVMVNAIANTFDL